MASTKTNFAWNIVLVVGNYLFPLITFPYVTRVLGVSNIGLCGYVDSIISYYVLFSTMGISSLGIREIAKVKEKADELNNVFSSLMVIRLALTAICAVALVVMTYTMDYFIPYRPYLMVGLVKLVVGAFGIEWFFQGTSNFRFITLRSLFIRVLYVILVFVFLHDESDTFLYFVLTSLTVIITSIINWLYAKKFVRFSLVDIKARLFIIPVLSYGLYMILTSMYTSFNVAFLGTVSNDTQVGYFTTATKLYTILMSVFTAFTMVMIPKVSELVAKKDYIQLRDVANQTFDLIFAFSFPLIIGSLFYAEAIVDIIAGKGYEGAVLPFRIVMLLLIVIALEQIIIQQFLMAVKDSKCVVILSVIGAFVGVLLNIILTPSRMAVGSSISWTASEICILIVSLFFFKKFFNMSLPLKGMLKYFLFSIPYVIICFIFYTDLFSWKIVLSIALCALWFIISNVVILKNKPIVGAMVSIKSWVDRKIKRQAC